MRKTQQIVRRKTRTIRLGDLLLGSEHPIRIQSMTNTSTANIQQTCQQIQRLVENGCEIIRVAVPDKKALRALPEITQFSPVPIIADIHFNSEIAILSLKTGIKGLRINPGNIGGKDRYVSILKALAELKDVALRIGVNAGSLENHLQRQVQNGELSGSEAMVKSALSYAETAEEEGVHNLKISLKASNVMQTIEACRILAKKSGYPLHLGVTEAGPPMRGAIKSSLGIGILLYEGIGDTLRVSLTSNPVLEVKAGYEILRALEIRKRGPELVSCPTCGRTEIDLIPLVEKVDSFISTLPHNIKVAVMGCVVNGPGEAREADIGISGGKNVGVVFKKGRIIRKVSYNELFSVFQEELAQLLQEVKNTNNKNNKHTE